MKMKLPHSTSQQSSVYTPDRYKTYNLFSNNGLFRHSEIAVTDFHQSSHLPVNLWYVFNHCYQFQKIIQKNLDGKQSITITDYLNEDCSYALPTVFPPTANHLTLFNLIQYVLEDDKDDDLILNQNFTDMAMRFLEFLQLKL